MLMLYLVKLVINKLLLKQQLLLKLLWKAYGYGGYICWKGGVVVCTKIALLCPPPYLGGGLFIAACINGASCSFLF